MTDIKEKLKKYYNTIDGEGWWDEAENYLRTSYAYPQIYPLQHTEVDNMLNDFHPIFRPLIISICPPSSETSMTKTVVAKGRSNLLKSRVPPHYIYLRCPAFQSRSRGNFGVLGMIPDKKYGKGIFSRALLNIPFYNKQKIKRCIMEAYGIAKHGKSIEEIKDFPGGGIFLLHPSRDPNYDSLTPYHDYNYVTLNVRLPKTYEEWLITLDGSVMVSKSATELLKYRKVAYVDIMNPVPSIKERYMLFKKRGIKKGAEVHFQEPLSIARIGKQQLPINTSPVEGYVYDYQLLTPNVDEKRKVYRLTLMAERPAQLGDKLESAGGLKNTIGGYVDDRDPTIVINPDLFKDRAIFYEVKKTGKIHAYITLTGKDSNISNRGVRFSNTLIQGFFFFPEKTRKKLIENLLIPRNILLNVPSDILDIIENFDINPKKYPIFYPELYYIRTIKKYRVHYSKNGKEKEKTFQKKEDAKKFAETVNGNINVITYYNEQLTHFGRAVEALYKELQKITHLPLSALPKKHRQKLINKAYDNLPYFYKSALDNWIKSWTSRLIIGDPHKSTQIKLNGVMRITLWKPSPEINEIEMAPELWEKLGRPEYVLWGKEPISRAESLRCLKVKTTKELKGEDQVVKVHPYLGMDYTKGEMKSKLDTDGDLSIIIPLKGPIPELMYPIKRQSLKKLWEESIKSFEDLPSPPYDYDDFEFVKELTCYNRYLTQEATVIEQFGGVKNHAMYTDIIKHTKEWTNLCSDFDIEAKAMQLEKFHPELKNASYCEQAKYLAEFASHARKKIRDLPPRHPFAEEWLHLSTHITFKERGKIRKMIRGLKKQNHPVFQLYWHIYSNSEIKL